VGFINDIFRWANLFIATEICDVLWWPYHRLCWCLWF